MCWLCVQLGLDHLENKDTDSLKKVKHTERLRLGFKLKAQDLVNVAVDGAIREPPRKSHHIRPHWHLKVVKIEYSSEACESDDEDIEQCCLHRAHPVDDEAGELSSDDLSKSEENQCIQRFGLLMLVRGIIILHLQHHEWSEHTGVESNRDACPQDLHVQVHHPPSKNKLESAFYYFKIWSFISNTLSFWNMKASFWPCHAISHWIVEKLAALFI